MFYKHRDIVIAYMDGKQIQKKLSNNTWSNVPLFDNQEIPLAFNNVSEYRIKSNTEKYRVALFKKNITLTSDNEEQSKVFEKSTNFVRWLTDWVEYEV